LYKEITLTFILLNFTTTYIVLWDMEQPIFFFTMKKTGILAIKTSSFHSVHVLAVKLLSEVSVIVYSNKQWQYRVPMIHEPPVGT